MTIRHPACVSAWRSLAIAVVAASACSRHHDEPLDTSGTSATLAEPHATATAPADAAVADAQTLKEHMRRHFAAISELQRAIARGHLNEAKDLAGWLGSHDEPLLEGWQTYVDDLHASAKAVEAAPDLPTAAALAARLGRACSRCHEAHDAVVTFAWEPAPDEADHTLVVEMKRHQWAAARLWDGLVGPSDMLWTEGANALATTQLDTAAAAGGVPRGDVVALAARIRELATKAAAVGNHDDRAQLYGELLSTCAGCHVLVRPRPVPGP